MVEGQVSYSNTTNVYVKFSSTELLQEGDTLYVKQNNKWVEGLVIQKKSSLSCVTKPLEGIVVKQGDVIGIKEKLVEKKEEIKQVIPDLSIPSPSTLDVQNEKDTIVKTDYKEKINGRLSLSTNASIQQESDAVQRVRASFSLNMDHIKNSKISTQTYVTYRHRYGLDQNVSSLFDDLKIFSLAVLYDISKTNTISVGRRINYRIANIGAIDGLQYEHRGSTLTYGIFGGARPNFRDYTFDTKLQQWGGYIYHEAKLGKGLSQSTISVADQRSDLKVDRRFIYMQHTNTIAKGITFFGSAEFDLYRNVDSVANNSPKLTSTYLSFRIKPHKRINFNISYDNRRNIIYYESNRLLVDQLLNQETRQGWRFQINGNVSKQINLGISLFLRYQGDAAATKNYVAFVNISNVPGIKSFLSLNYNKLSTYFLNGNIYSARLSRDLFKSKVNLELNYRKVQYNFLNSEQVLNQNIAGFGLTWNIARLTSFMLTYEGTFEDTTTWHRYFVTAIQRFKSK